jgi:hypothetical protein
MENPFINNVLSDRLRTGPTTAGVRKAAKMHHFGHQGREIAAINWIIVFDHDVTAMAPLDIRYRDGSPGPALGDDSDGFLVATAQHG